MKNIFPLGACAVLFAGCGTFIALEDDYERRCPALETLYEDKDKDGDGDKHASAPFCGDELLEGYVTNADDCDDEDARKSTKAPDDECDGIDQDCDGVADSGFVTVDCHVTEGESACLGRSECGRETHVVFCKPRWFLDVDGDGHGGAEASPGDPTVCPSMGSGYVGEPDDCDDGDPTIAQREDEEDNSLFAERCDVTGGPIDEDCDGRPGELFLRADFAGLGVALADDGLSWWSPTNSGWAIRPASASCDGPPSDATTGGDDEMVLGLGAGDACLSPGLGGQVFSPTVDTSRATKLYLIFSRFMHVPSSGGPPPTLSVWVRHGADLSFVTSYATSSVSTKGQTIGWQRESVDLTAYRDAATTVVFTYEIGGAAWAGPSLDDVRLTDDPCELP